ncbi:hypothetical protein PHMEG_00016910 [Phytophthora megakarya]|uniref:Uncharacterized protein n=1 Tax=Phytophthora megakarya TaxID=4795 RepID=A0A225VXV9_9STRA|nr:hypothetical protein PHMEG_00016910 [Phytophthora megakarya]
MTKFFALATAIAVAALTGSSTAADDKCVLLDFTDEESEFADLNAAIKTTKSAQLFGSVIGKYDPLVLKNVTLRSFNFSVLGKDVNIATTIDSISITGLKTLTPQKVNVTSPNSVGISTASAGQVAVDAKLIATLEDSDKSATADLMFVLEKPTLYVDVEANMYGCAPDVSESECSDLTIADLQSKLESATTKRQYASIMKEVLMKFKDASVKSFALDFESISDFNLDFDSTSFTFRNILRLVPEYSAEDINEKTATYDSYIATINRYAPAVLNVLINSMLEPWFGATCLSEK